MMEAFEMLIVALAATFLLRVAARIIVDVRNELRKRSPF